MANLNVTVEAYCRECGSYLISRPLPLKSEEFRKASTIANPGVFGNYQIEVFPCEGCINKRANNE